MPFYFFFTFDGSGYHLYGEGTGDKAVTDAALAQLSKLGEKEIVGLLDEAARAASK